MSRHSPTMPFAYNHPLPEAFLQSRCSQPMSPQFSNRSFTSTSSNSYSSNAGSYMSTSPQQYEKYDPRLSVHNPGRHHSHGSTYTNDLCISPLELQAPFHVESRHSHDNPKILLSSDSRHIVDYEQECTRVAPQKSGRRGDDSGSSGNEKDPSRRVPCNYEGCQSTFSRKADVNRHEQSTHDVKLIDCDVNNCSRTGSNGFARKDHLLEHKRGYHCLNIAKRPIKSNMNRHERE